MSFVATGKRTKLVSSNLLEYRRVVESAGVLAYAGAEDREVGVLMEETQTTGVGADGLGEVLSRNAEGTHPMIASAAITAQARVYGAANGKVSATPNGNFIGIALTAATADGDEIEVERYEPKHRLGEIETKTANFDIEVTDSGKTYTSTGAAGTITGTLPPAVPGVKYRFHVGAAQELRLDPDGTETIALPSTGVQGAAGKYLTANAIGETVEIECIVAGTWSVFGFTGTWTAEA